MKNKIMVVAFCLLLSGCGLRFAITKRNICEHPKYERISWGWLLAPRINPLHWHHGIHTKCKLCGQKFCEYYDRGKWIHKVITE